MNPGSICCAGTTPAIRFASAHLRKCGLSVSDTPSWNIRHLLLDIPSFRPGSPLCSSNYLDTLLNALPRDVIIWGGNLEHPALDGFCTLDLLKDETYLTENARITAYCTLQIAAPLLPLPLKKTQTLIIGWGRIGKYLTDMLTERHCPITVAARSAEDRQTLHSLGIHALDTAHLCSLLPEFGLIINTVPHPVLSSEDRALCRNAVMIDLASKKGIAGEDVIWARGLPGIHAPEKSGKLIADTFLRMVKEVQP